MKARRGLHHQPSPAGANPHPPGCRLQFINVWLMDSEALMQEVRHEGIQVSYISGFGKHGFVVTTREKELAAASKRHSPRRLDLSITTIAATQPREIRPIKPPKK